MSGRHLSREQKRVLVAESLRADPGLSNREHARRTGAHHQLVGNIREELVRCGQVDESSTSRGADGKVYPASQPPRPEPEPEPEPDGEDDAPAPPWEPAGHLHTNAPQAP